MRKIGFIIPDGTGIKNYAYSELIQILAKKGHEVVFFHSISDKAIDAIKILHNINFESHTLPQFRETPYQKFIRETICYARLLHNQKLVVNKTILTNWKPSKKGFKKKLFYKLVEFLGRRISSNYKNILLFENRLEIAIKKHNNWYVQLLNKVNPSILFSTHQRAMNSLPLVNAAHELGIKTVGAIFSWDNLPKARLTVKTSTYVVWSAYMKKELQLYYPEIAASNIEITGTPQFEFYSKKEFIMDKEVFFYKYSLDPKKKIICFSGDDVRTSPFDPVYLNDIAEIIKKENLNIQLLLRRAPVDVSGRFDAIIANYPTIIKEAAPLWNFDKDNLTNWQIIYPTYEDIELLVSTAYYCDAVINVGSTMAHDFAMFQKPGIYLNYNPVPSKEWNIDTIYQFQHFKSMGRLHPVLWLNSKEEIPNILNCIFDNPMIDNIQWIDIIAEFRAEASLNIANTLLTCI
jgi:hypothetical protein